MAKKRSRALQPEPGPAADQDTGNAELTEYELRRAAL
jgi:hypothetical protein